MKNEWIRLIKNLSVLAAVVVVLILGYRWFFSPSEDGLQIDDTPLRIESIRSIAEISSISYRDEVVVDTVELYPSHYSIQDPREWMRWYDRNVMRRLTLIVHGEVKFGINLSDSNYAVERKGDSLFVHLPEPTILDIELSPSKTEIFEERGKWSDRERKKLEKRALQKIKSNGEELLLNKKVMENTRQLFEKLVPSTHYISITFDHE